MIQQIAYYTEDIDKSVEDLMEAGYTNWVRDRVEGAAWMMGDRSPHPYVARLAFNYEIMDGIEFEFIQPLSEPNYVNNWNLAPGQIAHVGWHIDDDGPVATDAFIEQWGLNDFPEMEVFTTAHAGASDAMEDRRYHYRIFESERFPSLVKIIRRITQELSMAEIEARSPAAVDAPESH